LTQRDILVASLCCCFKWASVCRYHPGLASDEAFDLMIDEIVSAQIGPDDGKVDVVGLCTLNSFDPYPITYSLSNP
jgi:hypothetical protein